MVGFMRGRRKREADRKGSSKGFSLKEKRKKSVFPNKDISVDTTMRYFSFVYTFGIHYFYVCLGIHFCLSLVTLVGVAHIFSLRFSIGS